MNTKTKAKSSNGRLTYSQLMEAEKGPIWVINTANEKFETGAEVMITIRSNDSNQVEKIPRSWLPHEMTKRFSRKAVMESSTFADAISKGLVAPISAEAAQLLMEQPGARKELSRLEAQVDAIEAATASRGISRNVTVTTGDQELDEALGESGESQADRRARAESASRRLISINASEDDEDEEGADEEEEISQNFVAWVGKLNTMTDLDEVNSEMRMRGDLTEKEALYLRDNIEHDKIEEKLTLKLKKAGIID